MDFTEADRLIDAQVALPTVGSPAKVLFLRQPREWSLEEFAALVRAAQEEARTQETPFLFHFQHCNVWVYRPCAEFFSRRGHGTELPF